MSKSSWSETDDRHGVPEDIREAPPGQVSDDSYVTKGRNAEPVPVVGDEASIEDPVRPEKADSDEQLNIDEKEAIDKRNILKDRLRGNEPKKGGMREPSDREMGLTEEA
ncbi:hypothetical protein F4678DRAFT_462356 [Xylaria arbuscula]|nr:hypothetical protein F4678DRAFT_462356 [Xylaria arbuscula]